MDAKQVARDAIDRAMRLQTFEVTRPLPDNFEFLGTVPYDIKIADSTITVKVTAESLAEASVLADNFIESWSL